MKLLIALNSIAFISGRDLPANGYRNTRSMQETVPKGGLCNTMIPPSPLAPDDSSCWQWYDPPADGILSPDAPNPPTGCDYGPCETAVCECDSYCCETAWDLSCRGYYMKSGDTIENNYFVAGCSAKLLCCEQESAFPDPPIGAAMAGMLENAVKVVGPAFGQEETEFSCKPGSTDCCDTMKPPSFLPPDDSTCWQWWDAPENGILPAGEIPPKGCDYKPCEAAVCACDSYCCEGAWDLSCRGYHVKPGDNNNNNYFVDQCSAKLLCCEPESAFPDPPVGGASVITKESEVVTTEVIVKEIPVPVPAVQTIIKEVPVPVPAVQTIIKEIPVPVPSVQKVIKQVPVPVAQKVIKQVPVPVPVVKQVPVPVPVVKQIPVPVPVVKQVPVYLPAPVVKQVPVYLPAVPACVCPPLEVSQAKSSKSKGKSGKSGKAGANSSKKSKKCGKSGGGKSGGKSGKAGSKSSSSSSKSASVPVSLNIEYYEITPGCTCPRIAQVDCVEGMAGKSGKSGGKSGKAGGKSRRRLGQQ